MRKPVLFVVIAVNLALSCFATFAYLAYTSRLAVITGRGEDDVIYTQEGGLDAGIARYLYLSFVILFLQGVLAIFNLSVAPYAVEDEKVNRTCIALAVCNAALMAVLTVLLLTFNLVPAVQ